MEVNYRLIGTRLCQRRKELHLTQKKLGDKMHISSSHISAIETGIKQPSLETLLEFCKTLNINIENRNRISKIVDVFLEEEKLEK